MPENSRRRAIIDAHDGVRGAMRKKSRHLHFIAARSNTEEGESEEGMTRTCTADIAKQAVLVDEQAADDVPAVHTRNRISQLQAALTSCNRMLGGISECWASEDVGNGQQDESAQLGTSDVSGLPAGQSSRARVPAGQLALARSHSSQDKS